MSEVVKGLVEGGWALLVGWILPALLDVLLFTYIVYPSVRQSPVFKALPANDVTLVLAAVVIGIIFSALKTPFYRILEGYVLWPLWLFKWGQRRQIRRKEAIKQIVNYAGYSAARMRRDKTAKLLDSVTAEVPSNRHKIDAAKGDLADAEDHLQQYAEAGTQAEAWLADGANIHRRFWHIRRAADGERKADGNFIAKLWSRHPRCQSPLERAADLPPLRRKVLAEKFERYPVDEEDIAPTALGNAIRRFEKFGPLHYGLDQQALWYELMSVAPERTSKQVDQMRTAVDFFVSLLFGQLMVAVAASATIYFDRTRLAWLGFGALFAIVVALLSYRGAILSTDEWSYAVQALLNLGRKPLADALYLKLPREAKREQEMWRAFGRFLRRKPSENAFRELYGYRQAPPPGDKSSPK